MPNLLSEVPSFASNFIFAPELYCVVAICCPSEYIWRLGSLIFYIFNKNSMNMKSLRFSLLAMTVAGTLTTAWAGPDQFLGRWALTIPGGAAGWLSVTKEKGYYDGSILWGGGSVLPVSSICFAGDVMYVTRVRDVQRKDSAGKVVRTSKLRRRFWPGLMAII